MTLKEFSYLIGLRKKQITNVTALPGLLSIKKIFRIRKHEGTTGTSIKIHNKTVNIGVSVCLVSATLARTGAM